MSRQIVKKLDFLMITFTLCILFTALAFKPVSAGADGVEYQTHVQNIGWQDYVANGATAGTEGQSLQLEALKVRLTNPTNMGVEYRTHVANQGWQDYVSNDALSGTEGQNLQLEALSIRLNGSDSANYNIFYRVHAQDYGWLGWAKNGEDAGTTGQAKRLEAVQILLVPASEAGPEQGGAPFVEKPAEPAVDPNKPDQSSPIHYRTYIEGMGWNPGWALSGQETGNGENHAIEAIQIGLSDADYAKGGVEFKTCGSGGWTPWLSNDQVAGAPGDALQAIRVRVTGQLPYLYDVFYRVFVPNVGWSNFARNGGAAGSEGFGRGITVVQIFLTDKGNAPGPIDNAFVQGSWQWPLENGYRTITSGVGPRGGRDHDGIDVLAPEGAPIYAAKAGVVRMAAPNGNFGNCVVVENDSGEFCYYAHMVRIGAQVGQRVARGQVIGYVGSTGLSNKNHLHFEVYDDNGSLVDPLRFY